MHNNPENSAYQKNFHFLFFSIVSLVGVSVDAEREREREKPLSSATRNLFAEQCSGRFGLIQTDSIAYTQSGDSPDARNEHSIELSVNSVVDPMRQSFQTAGSLESGSFLRRFALAANRLQSAPTTNGDSLAPDHSSIRSKSIRRQRNTQNAPREFIYSIAAHRPFFLFTIDTIDNRSHNGDK